MRDIRASCACDTLCDTVVATVLQGSAQEGVEQGPKQACHETKRDQSPLRQSHFPVCLDNPDCGGHQAWDNKGGEEREKGVCLWQGQKVQKLEAAFETWLYWLRVQRSLLGYA